jgi:hypothetical protein
MVEPGATIERCMPPSVTHQLPVMRYFLGAGRIKSS